MRTVCAWQPSSATLCTLRLACPTQTYHLGVKFPTSLETFGFDPDFGGLLASKKIQGEVAKHHQIVVSMVDTKT